MDLPPIDLPPIDLPPADFPPRLTPLRVLRWSSSDSESDPPVVLAPLSPLSPSPSSSRPRFAPLPKYSCGRKGADLFRRGAENNKRIYIGDIHIRGSGTLEFGTCLMCITLCTRPYLKCKGALNTH
eukprot:1180898-Prorocentrum_minimum.AAC.1